MAQNCDDLAGDFTRIGSLMARLADHDGKEIYADGRIKGIPNPELGPLDARITYDLRCRRKQPVGRFGPGPCSVYRITREGPGMTKYPQLRKRIDTGNLYMLNVQLARDAARLWGCAPSQRGDFDGAGEAIGFGRPRRAPRAPRVAACTGGACMGCPLASGACTGGACGPRRR